MSAKIVIWLLVWAGAGVAILAISAIVWPQDGRYRALVLGPRVSPSVPQA